MDDGKNRPPHMFEGQTTTLWIYFFYFVITFMWILGLTHGCEASAFTPGATLLTQEVLSTVCYNQTRYMVSDCIDNTTPGSQYYHPAIKEMRVKRRCNRAKGARIPEAKP